VIFEQKYRRHGRSVKMATAVKYDKNITFLAAVLFRWRALLSHRIPACAAAFRGGFKAPTTDKDVLI
jgi:hypothetical protein